LFNQVGFKSAIAVWQAIIFTKIHLGRIYVCLILITLSHR
jgi:hypothetical protein